MKANLPVFLLTSASFVFAKQATANSIDTDRFNGNGEISIQDQSNKEASDQWCYDRDADSDHQNEEIKPKLIWLCKCIEQPRERYRKRLGSSNIRLCNPADIFKWVNMQTSHKEVLQSETPATEPLTGRSGGQAKKKSHKNNDR